ncbi:hypothetical protein [Tissierella praeacuta]|uniref:hypothetical protein n=1 Tax=Tissierella praeacuta TaxID=43131 RepID=UPI001C100FEF|nr:hypothetical protein [Tissierella praeacuta]MBU5255269.1 hypothetical protein [Tissierella praeacuta]
MFNKKFITAVDKLTLGIVVLVLFALVGCSQKVNNPNKTQIKENSIESIPNREASFEPPKNSVAEILSDLANQKFLIKEDQISDYDYETIANFGKAFVNLYTGAVAEQEIVSFENYISNENLLKFVNKMLELEQKKELKGGSGVSFGLENEFNELEFRILNENLCYLNLYFSNQGSGMSCKMLVQSLKKSLKIVDLYFGNKDGVDTIVTGHHKVRKLDNPELWDDQEWINGVFEKLEKYEYELLNK